MNTISTLNPSDWRSAYLIEQSAHRFPQSYALFTSCSAANYVNLKVTHNDQIIAYLISQVILDEASVCNIAVDPAYQHQGIGRTLLKTWQQQMVDRGVRFFFLEVRCSNHAAISLYESLGFHQCDRRKNYYPNGDLGFEDAIVMQYQHFESSQ